MASTPDGKGYWLVASDGGVFAFGDAGFAGSMGGVTLASPVTGIASTPDGKGYWFASANGTVFAFGDAGYFGSGRFAGSSAVGISEGPGTGYAPHDSGYPQGAYGSDISNWQCGAALPSGHTIGIVQVAGWSFGAVNPCLRSEAAWAGSGLELYLFLSFGEQSDRTERMYRESGLQLRVRRRPARVRTGEDCRDRRDRSLVARRRGGKQRLVVERERTTRQSSEGRSSGWNKRACRASGIYSNRSEWADCDRRERLLPVYAPNG